MLMESQLDKLLMRAYLSTDLTILNCEILKNTSYKSFNNVDGMTGQLLPKRYLLSKFVSNITEETKLMLRQYSRKQFI